jgi:hypothetical protein
MKKVGDAILIEQLSADIKKAEINLKRLQEECAVLIAKVEEQEKEVKQWSPVGGDWFIFGEGGVVESETTKNAREFGHERPTEQQAERAAVEMRKFNRLLALRDELCGDELVDWNANNTLKYCLEYNHVHEKWCVDYWEQLEYVTPCFTKHEHAQRACNMLNSGEVVL